MTYRNQAAQIREGIISGHRVRTVAEPVSLPASGGESSHESDVELLRRDGVVQAIRVTCSCGETIVLECTYEDRGT